MASPTCSLCGKRPHGKMASFYWAKFNGDNAREAWKQRTCRPCFEAEVQPWYERMLTMHASDGPFTCLQCNEDDPNKLIAFFLSSYVPNEPAEREGVDVCFAHAQAFLELTKRGSEQLVDRQADLVESSRARW